MTLCVLSRLEVEVLKNIFGVRTIGSRVTVCRVCRKIKLFSVNVVSGG